MKYYIMKYVTDVIFIIKYVLNKKIYKKLTFSSSHIHTASCKLICNNFILFLRPFFEHNGHKSCIL